MRLVAAIAAPCAILCGAMSTNTQTKGLTALHKEHDDLIAQVEEAKQAIRAKQQKLGSAKKKPHKGGNPKESQAYVSASGQLQQEEEGHQDYWDSAGADAGASSLSRLEDIGRSYACSETGGEVLAFYVTGHSSGARRRCMDAQLKQHCMPYEAFNASSIEPCPKGDWLCANKQVFKDYPDCAKHDVDWDSIKKHGAESGKDISEIAHHVLGNWCSRIRLLKEVLWRSQQDADFLKDYPAFLMLEDDAILDQQWTEEVVKDFVFNYDKSWDMVQLDPFGDKHIDDKIGQWRGKAVYRPSFKGKYSGFHAVLVKTASVTTILEKLGGMKVVPVDWMHKFLNESPAGLNILAWGAGVTRNPALATGKAAELGREMPLPDGCEL